MPTDIYARLRDLAASAEANPEEMRPVLLRVTTDLFALRPLHTSEEIRLYEEMAGQLIDNADETTLTNVARKLGRCLDAPPALIQRIRARGGEPAREILLRGAKIGWRDLRQIASSGACDQACAVAGRGDLDREIVRILAARPEREVLRALAANPKAPLWPEDIRLLAARGRDDSALARALLDRGDPTLDCLPLYLCADARERTRLLALALDANLIHAGRPEPSAALDAETAGRIEASAIRQKRASFALAMAELLKCDAMTARRIVDDEIGDALAIAFVAIGLPADVAARILLVAFPKIALSPESFDREMRLIKTVPRRVALRMIEAMAGAPRNSAPGATRPPIPRPAAAAERRDIGEATSVRATNQNRA
ncbi:DUF2336 domain-containing protein [Rhodoblastus acidophilus]|uniref:DUF2336 domain-containing protein n=1 Tax=Candidatus Rhodoblastus alkanivorans TaxID=2954117 RepID=A0ABS9Z596_9HYPH|nr:DUF2336 domain-containing protein [Candidatus Rhodoblastus alkanivorans]MCI4680541.1 DUF2336 domain-containing protein [Candidatus Rhodoblastus alkanivorans]MCI4682808.1 DUF2336 domain-containing protein [Candidatus Rhodoblastus alkanivorans]MDI4640117.1 DUF2336 domain-containing protein [Rhodoblastus acidophilus]